MVATDSPLEAGPDLHSDRPPRPILAALLYEENAYPDDKLNQAVDRARSRGARLAGIVQHRSRDPRHRCDMQLEDLASGRRSSIFDDRGRAARGCRMNRSALLDVVGPIERQLAERPALLLLNKFGKAEAEGGGLCDLIALAIGLEIPVLVAVPKRNLAAWRAFTADLSTALHGWGDFDEWLDGILQGPAEIS